MVLSKRHRQGSLSAPVHSGPATATAASQSFSTSWDE
jgi:hypothetical protein